MKPPNTLLPSPWPGPTGPTNEELSTVDTSVPMKPFTTFGDGTSYCDMGQRVKLSIFWWFHIVDNSVCNHNGKQPSLVKETSKEAPKEDHQEAVKETFQEASRRITIDEMWE